MGELAAEKHVQYILSVEKRKDDFVSVVMEHLRMNGAYWGLTTLDLLGKLDTVDVDEVLALFDKLNGSYQCGEGCELHCKLQKFGCGLDAHLVGSPMRGKVCYSWWVLSSLIMIDGFIGSIRKSLLSSSWTARIWKMAEFLIDQMML